MEFVIEPAERLCVPYRKRLLHAYLVDDNGGRELRIDYGDKEITFDDERFFAFGEQLIATASFTGAEALGWGPGYTWDELQPLLAELLAEGVLQRGEPGDDPRGGGVVASQVPPSLCPVPRAWSATECEAITRDLGDRAVEVGYLEAVVPVFRIAHPALDADDRQVGEANVFPARLRLDRPTEWRVCQYAGSRYRDHTPMNVTALRAMIKHWKPMMSAILAVRSELAARLGLGGGAWTIGELHVLSSLVLALPAYQLLHGGRAEQPPLHPVLSSLFRITDGVRLTAYEMLFSVERTRRAGEPMTAAALFERAEQQGLLASPTGVCAGPRHLIDEFLRNVVDGIVPDGLGDIALPAEVAALLAELPAAIDYGLYAMQTWAVSLSVWLAMSRAYQAAIEVLAPAGDGGLLARLHAGWSVLEKLQITVDHDRDVHWKAYVDAYERSWQALREPVGPPRLVDAIAPGPVTGPQREIAHRLHSLLADRAASGELPGGAAAAARLATIVAGYLREEQTILAATTALQAAINSVLERPRPTRPLEARDFRVHFVMSSGHQRFPYLLDALDDELGIAITCTASEIAIAERRPARPRLETTCYASSTAGGQ